MPWKKEPHRSSEMQYRGLTVCPPKNQSLWSGENGTCWLAYALALGAGGLLSRSTQIKCGRVRYWRGIWVLSEMTNGMGAGRKNSSEQYRLTPGPLTCVLLKFSLLLFSQFDLIFLIKGTYYLLNKGYLSMLILLVRIETSHFTTEPPGNTHPAFFSNTSFHLLRY